MTLEELNRKHTEANWLIAKRSASAAGKALLFSSESLEDTIRDIAALYGLTEDEVARLQPRNDSSTVASLQKMATGLFGQETDPNAGQAMQIARTAIQNGTTKTMAATLMRAGPRAAQAAAAGGSAASRGTPWGWIATATYAAGTAGWFAYSARAFNVEAFEIVREREGIEPTVIPSDAAVDPVIDVASERMTLSIELPTAAAIASKANALTSKAGTMLSGAFSGLRGLRS
ncbi:hypothetical protein [Sphingomonas sp. CFBP 8760]|uniref:hypothetical protein n=1 Tax=Sphingomonas sp. CFBP 8760 TaxID=2775282 RepID=UPI00178322FF|nr:hypothetical protein [Sphingomonas sp. CFBP 8760]MBD8548278.1 hypothetical protein [Sphingomonas sp. CFBP 8760]